MRSPLNPDPQRVLKFGIIGIGERCWQHINRINNNGDSCEILAICDIREDRLEHGLEVCRGAPATYKDYRDLLKHRDLNVILVMTPHDQHARMTIDALDAGCDVMVEKPMAMNVAECEQMNAAAVRNNRILMVGEQHRYFALNRKVKDLVDAGEIGRVVCISAPSFRGPWSKSKRWLNFLATSGGGVLSEACHDLDAFRWMIGSRAVRVAGFGGIDVFLDQDTLDHAQLIYEFENGVNLSFGFGIFVPGGYRNIGILGTHGRLEYTRYGNEIVQYRYNPGDGRPGDPIVHDVAEEMDEPGHPGTNAMYKEFMRCVRDRQEPLTAGAVMVDSVRMCTAAQDAVRRGEVIHLFRDCPE